MRYITVRELDFLQGTDGQALINTFEQLKLQRLGDCSPFVSTHGPNAELGVVIDMGTDLEFTVYDPQTGLPQETGTTLTHYVGSEDMPGHLLILPEMTFYNLVLFSDPWEANDEVQFKATLTKRIDRFRDTLSKNMRP